MEIQERIKKLKEFDPRHIVELEIESTSGLVTATATLEDVVFEGGNCVLKGEQY